MRLLFLSLLIVGCVCSTEAQENQYSLEMGVNFYNTLPLVIERNFSVFDEKASITSDNSLGFSLVARYLIPETNRLKWLAGAELGRYSYDIDLFVSDDFRQLGWGGYTNEFKGYNIQYLNAQLGVRYLMKDVEKVGKLYLDAAITSSYHVLTSVSTSSRAILDNGQSRAMFYADFINNVSNSIIFAPSLNAIYEFEFNDNHLFISLNGTFSRQTPFEGYFEIYGDNEELRGNLKKVFILMGGGFGIVRHL